MEGYSFAEEVVDLCRLPALPHERLPGLPEMNARQAFYFDLSFVRAAKEKRLYDFSRDAHSLGEKDMFGTGKMAAAMMRELARS